MLLLPNWPLFAYSISTKCTDTSLETRSKTKFVNSLFAFFVEVHLIQIQTTFLQFLCTSGLTQMQILHTQKKPSLACHLHFCISLFKPICYKDWQTLMYWNESEYLPNLKIQTALSKNTPTQNKPLQNIACNR